MNGNIFKGTKESQTPVFF